MKDYYTVRSDYGKVVRYQTYVKYDVKKEVHRNKKRRVNVFHNRI